MVDGVIDYHVLFGVLQPAALDHKVSILHGRRARDCENKKKKKIQLASKSFGLWPGLHLERVEVGKRAI